MVTALTIGSWLPMTTLALAIFPTSVPSLAVTVHPTVSPRTNIPAGSLTTKLLTVHSTVETSRSGSISV